jgi:hypothetical protein
MKIRFNGEDQPIASIENLSRALDRFDVEPLFELSIETDDGPSMIMLRNADHAWLMYLRFHGDSGFVTKGDQSRHGASTYRLSNGQVDEYPLSWCIGLEQCYKAIAYFFVNDGARYDLIDWYTGK